MLIINFNKIQKVYKSTCAQVIAKCHKMSINSILENQNPNVYTKSKERIITSEEEDDSVVDEIDNREIFGKINEFHHFHCNSNLKHSHFLDLIRDINDPEHPLTLEELRVVQEDLILVDNDKNTVHVNFTPTIPHCSMATLIGLSIRVKLLRCLPDRFKVKVEVTPGTHNAEHSVNKQLADKERVAAALENVHLIKVINQCVSIRQKG